MPQGRYRIISFGRQIGIGVAGSYNIAISAVAKRNSSNAPYCIPNESICAEIGRFLHLPIPPSGIVYAPNAQPQSWFASLDFNLVGATLPPVDTTACVARVPDLSTSLLLFDTLMTNCDRHRGNFAVDFLAQPPKMSVFDHSHALFGFQVGWGQQRSRDLRDRLGVTGGSHTQGNRHCLLDHIDTDRYFDKWLERIEAIPDFFINDVCQDAVGLGITDADAQAARSFLVYRRDHIRRIIEAHRLEFHRINQWGLFP